MRLYEYEVHFSSGFVKVTADCPGAAKILAQAQRIKDAMSYLDVRDIIKLKGPFR